MKKTVLITGTSSGIGKLTAMYFAEQGWNVAATMRTPEKDQTLKLLPGVKLYALDVTDPTSVSAALAAANNDFGKIDVVVNNAGYGADGVFESMTDEFIRQQFDTNVFGLMRVTRESIKLMREQGGGVIVQISSMGGKVTFPNFSIYHSTKWAVEGFTESLHYELVEHGIRLKIVEPGAIKTEFYGAGRKVSRPSYTNAYDKFADNCEKVSMGGGLKGEDPLVVAKAVFKASTDGTHKLRYPVGAPAPLLLVLRKLLPESWFYAIIRMSYKL